MANSVVLKNDRLIKSLRRQDVDRTPVWLMRQAGRYLPEYRDTRKKAGSFMQLCKTPELACEVTMQPLLRYRLDAAILFSDILTIPDAMGLGLHFVEGEGPKFTNPIQSTKDIDKLGVTDPEQDLSYVIDAVRMIHQELADSLPLIGFAGSPWTLAAYMIEGSTSKTFNRCKALMFNEPQAMHMLLDKLAQSVTAYLNAQINAGVNAVMLFDSWGGMLAQDNYMNFSLSYMQQIIDGLQREHNGQKIPVILFTKSGGLWLEQIANTGCDAVGLDWTINIGDARRRIGDKVALQGNLDPAALFAKPERIEELVQQVLQDYGKGSGHVFNLGHGMQPDMDPEHVTALVEAVHKYSPAFHN